LQKKNQLTGKPKGANHDVRQHVTFMTKQHLVNSIGLVCDIIGAVIIWRYGLPESIDRQGATHIISEQIDEAEKAKAQRYDCLAKFGVGILIFGFFLQLVSNFL
jgi:preprotein translocase subunit SecF